MSEYRLIHEMLARSHARTWAEAKLEWELLEVYETKERETCLCGHYPIVELCVLVNKINGKQVTVGSVCVRQFLGLPSHKIFGAFKRIQKDSAKPLNAEAIEYLFKKELITPWENKFCTDTMRMRDLSEGQMKMRININKKVVRKMQRPRRS